MVVGPGAAGAAMASADGLFGINIDILGIGGHDHRKGSRHPVARVNAQQNVSEQGERRGFGSSIPGGVAVGERTGGGGGGPAPSSGRTGRPTTLPPVPTEPSGRIVVIRSGPSVQAPVIPAAPAPVVVPPVIEAPVAPVPSAGALPPVYEPPAAAVPPVTPQPHGQPGSGHAVPTSAVNAPGPSASFRVGYADVLRTADVEGLILAAVPGISGMVALTAFGGLLGYRQARAAQSIRSSAIARFMN